MKKVQLCFIACCVVLFLAKISTANQLQLLYTEFTGTFPANIYDLGTLPETTSVRVVTSWTSLGGITTKLFRPYINQDVSIPLSDMVISGSSLTISKRIDASDRYWVVVESNSILDYLVQIYINGQLRSATGTANLNKHTPVHKITVTIKCRLSIVFTSALMMPVTLTLYRDKALTLSLASFAGRQLSANLPDPGDYYLVASSNSRTQGSSIGSYTIFVYTYCGSYCVNSAFSNFVSTCPACGNGILEEGEQCDNGNKIGCSQCLVTMGYRCTGGLGSLSFCSKYNYCGDAIVDQGEQCDNGRKVGCSNCQPDSGYICTANIGFVSVCTTCGNGVVDAGEQCDNGNKLGCTINCLPDAGYICSGNIGSVSVCTTCGNGIVDQGEQCDNGKKIGCSNCRPDSGYICTGNIGFVSVCTTCGNNIVDAGEQCDNGNKLGCTIACQPDNGYTCTSNIGTPSSCYSCGNGIVEAWEECDNGNAVGCSIDCKVDPGFECKGVNSVCVRKITCGNSIIEMGETCDDGNKNSGDGCTQACAAERGYDCTGEPSKCQNRCGNGIYEPPLGEQCDNGNRLGCYNCVVQNGFSCSDVPGGFSTCFAQP